MSNMRDDIKAILGDVDEVKIIEILALKPTVAELEEASIWAEGDGEAIGKGGQPPLTGKVAAILEIITADDEEDEPPKAH